MFMNLTSNEVGSGAMTVLPASAVAAGLEDDGLGGYWAVVRKSTDAADQ